MTEVRSGNTTTLEEKLAKLHSVGIPAELENLKKDDIAKSGRNDEKYVRRGSHGGRRIGSGRKTTEATLERNGKKAAIEAHGNEEIAVTVTDKATGRVIVQRKPSYIAVLEKLRSEALKGNVDAANKWLDRVLGKPKQPIIGEDDDSPMRIDLTADFDRILEGAYGRADASLD